jgi:hypothetical protein
MDADRFDTLTRTLTVARSRRRALAALVGGVLAASSGRAADAKRGGRGEHRSSRTTICHKPGTPAEQTLEVDDNGLPDHQAHGDTLGPCGPSGATCPPLTDRGVECACVATANGAFACAYTFCSGVAFDDTCLDPNRPCPGDSVCAANPCCGSGIGFGCLSRCTDLTACTCSAAPATCDPDRLQACGVISS